MQRGRLTVLVFALAFLVAGCDEALDQLGVEGEDREQLEDLLDDLQDAADGTGNSGPDDGDNNDPDGNERPQDPDWNPQDGVPPPPGEPDESADYSGEPGCPSLYSCGHASYDGDDGEDIRDHYENEFGRPADETVSRPSQDGEGNSYDATTSTWQGGDTEVTVYSDHHGTDVTVQVAPSP